MSGVDATNPAALTLPLEPKTMPFGLTRKTWPLDCNNPLIDDETPPVTRLSVAEAALGWTIFVISPAPMLNEFQLITVPDVLVVTFSVEPELEIVAEPLVTVPPVGFAAAATGKRHARSRTKRMAGIIS